jgi:hypothetical protein
VLPRVRSPTTRDLHNNAVFLFGTRNLREPDEVNSERKTLLKIGVFIFASALVGGYLKERVRLGYNPLGPRTDVWVLAQNVFSGALEYFKEPLGLLAVFLFVCLFVKAKGRQ